MSELHVHHSKMNFHLANISCGLLGLKLIKYCMFWACFAFTSSYDTRHLRWVEWWLPERSVSLSQEPEHVTLFGKGAFADIIQLKTWRWDHPGLSGWALNLMTSTLNKSQNRKHNEEEARWRQRLRLEWRSCKSKNANCYQKLVEPRKGSPLDPPEGVQPCWHLDFRLFWHPELWKNKFLLFEVTRFVVIFTTASGN